MNFYKLDMQLKGFIAKDSSSGEYLGIIFTGAISRKLNLLIGTYLL